MKKHSYQLKRIKPYLFKIADGIFHECAFAVFLTDQESNILFVLTNFEPETADTLGLAEGSCWAVEKRGTTAAGLALMYKNPIGVNGTEHYQKRYHPYRSMALPIYDAEGSLIYVLGLMLPEAGAPRIMNALMMTAVQGIEREFYHEKYMLKIHKLNHSLDQQSQRYRIQASLLHHIFDNTSDLIFMLNQQYEFSMVNRAGKNFLKKIGSANLSQIYESAKITDFEGNPLPAEESPFQRTFSGNKVRDYEVCIQYEKEKQYFTLDCIPFQDQLGRSFAIGILKNVTDFIELEQLKDQYKNKAEELENIINTISDGVAMSNEQGEYTLFNPSCSEIFKYNRLSHDLYKIGMTFEYLNMYDEDGNQITNETFPAWEVLKGKTIEKKILRLEFEDETRYVSFSGVPVLDEQNRTKYAVYSYSDLTDLKKQQLKLYQNNQFIKNVMESIGAPVIMIDYPACTFITGNSTYCKLIEELTGETYAEVDLIGKSFYDFVNPETSKEAIEAANSVAAGKKISQGEQILLRDAEGEEKHLQVVYTPVYGHQGEVSYITAVGVDITNQVMAQRDMEKLAKLKEEYFSVISHELRSPISVVHSAIQLLTGEFYTNEFSQSGVKILKKVEKNTYRLLRLVNNLLDITKAEAGYMNLNYCYINLAAFTESLVESVQPVAQRKQICLELIKESESVMVDIDPEKFERVVLNLLSNAVKFTHEGGHITVTVKTEGQWVHVSVKDDGIGISVEQQGKIFDRFYMIDDTLFRKNQGTGIGLSLVKQFVDMMKGDIQLISEAGRGAEFIVSFPYEQRDEAEEEYYHNQSSLEEKILTEFSDVKK